MRHKRSTIASLIALVTVLSESQALAQVHDCRRIPVYSAQCFSDRSNPRCRPIPAGQAPCFTVHARLTFANGAPVARLAPVGSRRIFGVLGGEGDAASPTLLPPAADTLSAPPTPGPRRELIGDFRVCPLAAERRGWMRPVCIASASHLTLATPSER